MDRDYLYVMQILFALVITIASQSVDWENKHKWVVKFARYVMYVITIQVSKPICIELFAILYHKQGFNIQIFNKINRSQLMMFVTAVVMLLLNDEKLYTAEFPLIFLAILAVKYPEVEPLSSTGPKVAVTYGTGMACSFIEGYLVHVLPSDGRDLKGVEDKIRAFESTHGVVFPVKRLFIIITKSMHCPPDLKEFNDKSDRIDVNRLEACLPLEDVVKDVAGVKSRGYRNSAYKIMRPNKRPVYIAAECATPLHTLYKVVHNRQLYKELSDVNVEHIVSDFVGTLRKVLQENPDLKNRCELVYFDDTDESANLSDVLIDRIQHIEPNFEQFINRTY